MEYRESFDISYLKGSNSIFPDENVPDFRPAMLDLADKTKELTFRVLRSLALSLDLVIYIFEKRNDRFTLCVLCLINDFCESTVFWCAPFGKWYFFSSM